MTMTWTDIPRVVRTARSESVPLPKPQPFATPVLIGDCVTPLAGDTVLALLWRRLQDDQIDP